LIDPYRWRAYDFAYYYENPNWDIEAVGYTQWPRMALIAF